MNIIFLGRGQPILESDLSLILGQVNQIHRIIWSLRADLQRTVVW